MFVQKHPVYEYLLRWKKNSEKEHAIEIVTALNDARGGDVLFLISCNDIVGKEVRDRYKTSLVIHASDVPRGRGWSPHIWQILEGRCEITVTLMEVEDRVDTGLIWGQKTIEFGGHELYNEINEALFEVEVSLMDYAIQEYQLIEPYSQPDVLPTYYKKRNPEDSEIDPSKSIIDNFNLLRVSDPVRFPAFFSHLNNRYRIKIEKVE